MSKKTKKKLQKKLQKEKQTKLKTKRVSSSRNTKSKKSINKYRI